MNFNNIHPLPRTARMREVDVVRDRFMPNLDVVTRCSGLLRDRGTIKYVHITIQYM